MESAHHVWVSDTTYIKTEEGWAYLAVTMDLATRYVAVWSVSARNDSELTAGAASKALARFGAAKPMHHSDRGSTYACWEFQRAIAGLERSMSRKGNCYDNAAMESFSTLKAESRCCGAYANADELARALFVYIESFYNTRRIHTSLDKSPLEALKEHGPSSPSCSQGACSGCALRGRCLSDPDKADAVRRVGRDSQEHLAEEMFAKSSSEDGKRRMRRRARSVEPAFGNIKSNLGFRRLSLRGLEPAGGEFALMCIAHNLLKMAKMAPQRANRRLVSAMRTLQSWLFLRIRVLFEPMVALEKRISSIKLELGSVLQQPVHAKPGPTRT